MKEKKMTWSDIGQIALELGGGKLALDVLNAILPKPVSCINKVTAVIIGSAAGNMAFHNQVDPFYDEIEAILQEIRKKNEARKNASDNS
jgi:hypothetical protein